MSDHEIPLNEHEFRLTVVRQLAEVTTTMQNVVTRLDTLNGSVAKHEARLGSLEVKDAIAEATRHAKLEAKRALEPWIRPVVFAIACALAITILMNGPAIVKAFGK